MCRLSVASSPSPGPLFIFPRFRSKLGPEISRPRSRYNCARFWNIGYLLFFFRKCAPRKCDSRPRMQKILPPSPPPPPPPPPHHRHRVTFPTTPSGSQSSASSANEISEDERGAKRILKETVDAVVNSFAKHTREFGRGRSKYPAI